MNKNIIPSAVSVLFTLESCYKGHISLLGTKNEESYYHYVFTEPVTIGFPKVVRFCDGKATLLEPDISLEVLRLFVKD